MKKNTQTQLDYPALVIRLMLIGILSLFTQNGHSNELDIMERTIAEYYSHRANCKIPGKIKTQMLQLAVNSRREYWKIYPTLIASDIELKAKIDVCNIQAHHYLWLRKTREFYRIVYYEPVKSVDQRFP